MSLAQQVAALKQGQLTQQRSELAPHKKKTIALAAVRDKLLEYVELDLMRQVEQTPRRLEQQDAILRRAGPRKQSRASRPTQASLEIRGQA